MHYQSVLRKGTTHDTDRRGCQDCLHLRGAVSWWCTSGPAKKFRGTSIPGVHDCSFWAPCLKHEDLPLWRKVFGVGLIPLIGRPPQ